MYHPDGTTQFQAGSHPVPILRYVRKEADRHPGASHDNIVWEPVTFKPWVAPVIIAVRLVSYSFLPSLLFRWLMVSRRIRKRNVAIAMNSAT